MVLVQKLFAALRLLFSGETKPKKDPKAHYSGYSDTVTKPVNPKKRPLELHVVWLLGLQQQLMLQKLVPIVPHYLLLDARLS